MILIFYSVSVSGPFCILYDPVAREVILDDCECSKGSSSDDVAQFDRGAGPFLASRLNRFRYSNFRDA